jgi:hypothetical protein
MGCRISRRDRDESKQAFGLERGNCISGTRARVMANDHDISEVEAIEECRQVLRQDSDCTAAQCIGRQEPHRTAAAQIWHHNAPPSPCLN